MPRTVLVASNNAHKLHELCEIVVLAGAGDVIRLITPADLGLAIDPDESAPTYAGNALIKARAFATHVRDDPRRLFVLADDSGLEVDALGGRPGVHSARYHRAAPNGDGCAALLKEMNGVPEGLRAARFRCVMALAGPDRAERLFEGICEGHIGRDKRGANGFGFDPVFVVAGESRHLAEMSSDEKHRVSHRGMAMRVAIAGLTSPT
jgi:XTP/dITP diphosphohydrolase